jgi:hypothetical protein
MDGWIGCWLIDWLIDGWMDRLMNGMLDGWNFRREQGLLARDACDIKKLDII